MKVYIQRFWKLFAQIIPIWFRGFCWKKIMRCVINEGYFQLDNTNRFEVYVFEFDDLFGENSLLSLIMVFDFCSEKKILNQICTLWNNVLLAEGFGPNWQSIIEHHDGASYAGSWRKIIAKRCNLMICLPVPKFLFPRQLIKKPSVLSNKNYAQDLCCWKLENKFVEWH